MRSTGYKGWGNKQQKWAFMRRSAGSKMLTLNQSEELADLSVGEPSRYGFTSFSFIAIEMKITLNK